MSIVNRENVLDLLYSYNPWWRTGFMESMLEGFKRSNGHKNLITIKAADSMC